MPAFLFGTMLGAVDASWNLHHGALDCGRDWISPAPKEQPPRKLSGRRTAVRSNTLESGLVIPAPPKEQPALSREISQGKDRGGTEFA
jgi:hypothetical protein